MKNPPPWHTATGRQNNLDFMRLIFAILVIFSHSYPILYGEPAGNQVEPISVLTRGQITGGGLAVAFFFIISGYLIAQSWANSKSVLQFMRNRVLRIYPGFIVASLICLLIVAPLGSPHPWEALMRFNLLRFLKETLFLYLPGQPDVFVANPIPYAVNGAAWTIRYEFASYLLIAFLGIVGVFQKRCVVIGLFFLFWVAFILQQTGLIPTVLPIESGRTQFYIGESRHYYWFVMLYLAGTLFWLFRERIPYSSWLFGVVLSCLAIASISGHGLLLYTLPLTATYAIFYVGFLPVGRISPFGENTDISYGVYLYGFPIGQLLVYYLGIALAPFSLALAASVIAIGVGWMSWVVVERRFLRRKRQSITLPPSTTYELSLPEAIREAAPPSQQT